MSEIKQQAASAPNPGHFPPTPWSLLTMLSDSNSDVAQGALDRVCDMYYYPLYSFVRRKDIAHQDTQDVLHGFFEKFLRNESLKTATASKGTLRSFLCSSLGNFIIDWRHNKHKRERMLQVLDQLDWEAIQRRFEVEEVSGATTPEAAFDRKWAEELLVQVIKRLERSYATSGKPALFQILLPALKAGARLSGADVARMAAEAGKSEGAISVAMSRLRQDFVRTLHQEVARTVGDEADVQAELGYLWQLFRG